MQRALLALALLLPATLALAQGIAVVDMEAVLANHPNTPNDRKTLESTLADYTKERDALRADLDRRMADLEKERAEAQNPMLAPAKAEELRQAVEAKLRTLQDDFRRADAQMQERTRTLQEMERRLIDRTSDEIEAHIAAYAKENKLDAVLYRNAAPYVRPELDITDAIIRRCGGTPPKKDTAKDGAELAPPAKATPPAAN